MNKTAHKGFTLVELLIVIAIVAILASVVVLIINPLELTRRGRDASRLADLAHLQQAISVAVQEATDTADKILCFGLGTTACNGKSTDAGARNAAGTGWVKVDLSSSKAVSVPTLPIDPMNPNTATYHYLYCADTASNAASWEINTVLESEQQKGKMATDGGDKNATDTTGRYEVGSKLTIEGTGTCTY